MALMEMTYSWHLCTVTMILREKSLNAHRACEMMMLIICALHYLPRGSPATSQCANELPKKKWPGSCHIIPHNISHKGSLASFFPVDSKGHFHHFL
jgi:hypothetical protein